MKRVLAIGLIVAGVAFPAFCQRGSAHGGFAGRGGGFHGGSSPSFGRRSAGPGLASGYRGRGGGWGYAGRGRFRLPYAPFYGPVLPYGYVPWGDWLDYGFPDDSGEDQDSQYPPEPMYAPDEMPPYGVPDSAAQPYGPPGRYGAETPPPDRAAPRQPYRAAAEPPAAATAQTQEPLMLVFKDGRPAQQVRNYILTPEWIYIQDENRRAIPVDQLDLTATAQVNRQAGVDFQLPALPR